MNNPGAALRREIKALQQELGAIILAHFYQLPEIQEVADFVGDSLQLAQQAAAGSAEVVVVCGVHFMAESAAILNPGRRVLLPELSAGCPMAEMVTAEKLRAARRRDPELLVVSYVNTSAAVKAESDICCTSSNAERIVLSLPPERPILFVPDQNLAAWVRRRTGRKIIPWPGYCPLHHAVRREAVLAQKAEHPEALLVVHPECRPEVTEMADGVFSTAGIVRFVRESAAREFIIGTEVGLLHHLQRQCPDKRFFLASPSLVCPDMKKITLEKLAWSLVRQQPRVEVAEPIASQARRALERMLAIQ